MLSSTFIDEVGYIPFAAEGAQLLFQVFSDRYEKASLIVTSNLPFAQWTTIFGDAALTAALLDRLTHHCSIHEFDWESIRFTESLQRHQKAITPAPTKWAMTHSDGSKPRTETKKRMG